ncbi:Cysteinyl-tRNA synthetase [Hordeum vulgare]|nr:Cysteinyl-tRNA synthetase [Hordeum vulgare]
MSSDFVMFQQKKTTYAMFTQERRFEIKEHIRERCAAHIIVGMPSDSQEPVEEPEKEQQHSVSMEEEDKEQSKEEKEQPEKEKELDPAPRFNMVDVEAEFAVAQADEMAEQQAILESIQNEDYVEATRRFIQQE